MAGRARVVVSSVLLSIGLPTLALSTPAAASNAPPTADDTRAQSAERAMRAMRAAQSQLPTEAVWAFSSEGSTEVARPERRPAHLMADVLTSPDAARNAATYVEMARQALRSLVGVATLDVAQVAEAGGESGGGTARVGLPFGDLTGDGLDDALSLETMVDGDFELVEVEIRALAGKDGTPVWARSLESDLYWGALIPSGDLAGDGSDDLLLWELFIDSVDEGPGCPALVACAGEYRLEFHWVVTAISGPNGSDLWSHTYAGTVEDTFAWGDALAAFAYVDTYEVTNTLVVPFVSADHDGDGGADIVIDAWDVRAVSGVEGVWALLALAYLDENMPSITTRAEVARGADGTTVFARTAAERPGEALLLPAGDAVGDGTGDLLWEELDPFDTVEACVFVLYSADCLGRQQDARLELIDGSALAPVWTTEVGDAGSEWVFTWPAQADLDGDGLDDLLLEDWRGVPSDGSLHQGVISGADGSLRWSHPVDSFLVPMGAAGGEPGADLLGVRFEGDVFSETQAVILDRLDGATGAPLLTTTHEVGAGGFGFGFVYAYLMGDGDADGALDIVVGTEAFDFDNGGWGSTIRVESGATGLTLFSEKSTLSVLALPAGNLDGRAGEDLALIDAEYDWPASAIVLRLRAISLPSGEEAWQRTDRMWPWSAAVLFPTAPQVPGPGGDLLYSRIQVETGNRVASRTEGLDGLTGRSLWGFGDELSPPPPPPTGVIAGRVTDASGVPLEYICVEAYDAGGGFDGQTLTAADGTYTLGSLPTSDYRVRFFDCGGHGLASEWYDNQPDYESADLVPVVDGQATNDINAVLTDTPLGAGDWGTRTGETGNDVDCGSSRGDETLFADDVGGTGYTARVGGTSIGDGYAVVCNDDGPLQGRIIGRGSAYERQGALCADGDADNPWPFGAWACLSSDRDGDGVTDVGCQGPGDSWNSTDPNNSNDLENCSGGLITP